jgi:hypothetical protein
MFPNKGIEKRNGVKIERGNRLTILSVNSSLACCLVLACTPSTWYYP